MNSGLHWLPIHPDFLGSLNQAEASSKSSTNPFSFFCELANHNLDPIETNTLDRRALRWREQTQTLDAPQIKLAVLASTTYDHLLPSIRVGALRRGFWTQTWLAPFQQQRQEILNQDSELWSFKPDVVLLAFRPDEIQHGFALDLSEVEVLKQVEAQLEEWVSLWDKLRQQGIAVIQAGLLSSDDRILGHMDASIPAAPLHQLRLFNQLLAVKARSNRVCFLDIDALASQIGRENWFDPSLWFHAKQDISPAVSPLFGDHVARLLAALRGQSKKCLVLDLDQTLWGGVIGDDGVEGIELGPGTAVGESYAAFQDHLKRLHDRGVLLAICSKNDPHNALSPFEKHPSMVLKREDFAAFYANWQDKATNLEAIARDLNLGLDAFVFFDDNPTERALVRTLLPMVSVPEVSDDPATFIRSISDAGYFEAVTLTAEDMMRASHYQANTARLSAGHGQDLEHFLKDLSMVLLAAPFDDAGLGRITQLINKSNQYNLTTRRYTEAQISQMMHAPDTLTIQARLKDRFGDQGMISVIIANNRPSDKGRMLVIDTWLMSCRVLGRYVEHELLNHLVVEALKRGCLAIEGEYIPTPKNGLARDHYSKLGFMPIGDPEAASGRTRWSLSLDAYRRLSTPIDSGAPLKGEQCQTKS